MDDAEVGMENALKANPRDIAEQYETQRRELREVYGEAMPELKFRNKVAAPSRLDRRLIDQVIAEMAPKAMSCRWCRPAAGPVCPAAVITIGLPKPSPGSMNTWRRG